MNCSIGHIYIEFCLSISLMYTTDFTFFICFIDFIHIIAVSIKFILPLLNPIIIGLLHYAVKFGNSIYSAIFKCRAFAPFTSNCWMCIRFIKFIIFRFRNTNKLRHYFRCKSFEIMSAACIFS